MDGTKVVAVANADFVSQWADAYNANNGIYITAKLVDANEIGETIVAIPAVAANGVAISGEEL